MNNRNLQRVFLFSGTFPVRTFDQNGEIWFVAVDVCTALTINAGQTRRLDDDEKGLRTIQTLGGKQEMLIINESGLYSLILTSRKTEAKRFKRWITHEVLPSIRKSGGYDMSTNARQMALENIEGLLSNLQSTRFALSQAEFVTQLLKVQLIKLCT